MCSSRGANRQGVSTPATRPAGEAHLEAAQPCLPCPGTHATPTAWGFATWPARPPAGLPCRPPSRLQLELGLGPADESRAYLTFLVPKTREDALPAFLRQLDARRQEVGGPVRPAGPLCLACLFDCVAWRVRAFTVLN